MTLDEQELRRRLTATATQASPTGFTAGTLARRVRRRRARITAAISGAVLAVAAVAVAVPIGLNSGQTAHPPPPLPFRLSLTMAVNGQSRHETWPHDASRPISRFVIAPGRHLSITVDVNVPAHARVNGLWLGINKGSLGYLRGHRPIGMHPILAHSRQTLTAGSHTFRMRWTAPAGLRRGLYLAVAWSTGDMDVSGTIAELAVRVGDHIYRAPGAVDRPAPNPAEGAPTHDRHAISVQLARATRSQQRGAADT
jgi:hypothetical protein